ncbi:MAG: glycosyltransferase [Myxococcota bacterium]
MTGLLVMVPTAFVLAGLVALWRTRRRTSGSGTMPMTVLKPLCGTDPNLEANLRSFFEQTHPRFELVFGVQGADDPSLAVVKALRDRHPNVRCRIVVHGGGRGVNPKVDNLRAMLPVASHDLLVISDSNVRVHPGYLEELAAEFDEDTGVVSSLFYLRETPTVGAVLESFSLAGDIAPSVALTTSLGHPIVVGKSMAFRRQTFEALGGFSAVANVLAEDYVIGRMFHEAGYRIVVCPTPVENVAGPLTVQGFFRRHLRWNMIRLRLQPMAWFLEPLSRPVFVACGLLLVGADPLVSVLWALGLIAVRDGGASLLLRGDIPTLLHAAAWIPFGILRDVVLLAAWVRAPFHRHVTWRGHRVRVSAGTRLYANRPAPETAAVEV